MEPSYNDNTPKKQQLNDACSTPKSFARFLLLSSNSSFTPSPSLSQRVVRNPFENHLYERLHLPVISSPSLFQTLNTPNRHSNSRSEPLFEWTIEEMSQLNPVNMVINETQFREELDPIREAEAQAKISSFFTEQKIVPSPQVSILRHHKIILKDEKISTKIINSTALLSESNKISAEQNPERPQKRDFASQTALTLPPTLPKEVEDLLKKYHFLKNEEDEDEDVSSNDRSTMMDISMLRRKLFINRPDSPCDESFGTHINMADFSPPPRTPELTKHCDDRVSSAALRHEASFGSDMFGEISPIRGNEGSPSSSDADVSMISECKDKTPSRFRRRKVPKDLSASFSLLQELDTERDVLPAVVFPDSGYSADEGSKLHGDYMQY